MNIRVLINAMIDDLVIFYNIYIYRYIGQSNHILYIYIDILVCLIDASNKHQNDSLQ